MARYYEAASSLLLGDSDGENKIKTFIKENPTNIMADNAKLLYANYLFKNKKYRDALKTYKSTKSNNLAKEEQDEYNFKKAYCYYQTQNISEASAIFKELSQKDNAYRNDAQYYYAHILYINNEKDKALEYFNILKGNNKYKDIANIYILQTNFEKGNYTEVIEKGDDVLQKAHKNRKSDIALMLAEQGATVLVNYNGSREKAMEVVAQVEAAGGTAEAYAPRRTLPAATQYRQAPEAGTGPAARRTVYWK